MSIQLIHELIWICSILDQDVLFRVTKYWEGDIREVLLQAVAMDYELNVAVFDLDNLRRERCHHGARSHPP